MRVSDAEADSVSVALELLPLGMSSAIIVGKNIISWYNFNTHNYLILHHTNVLNLLLVASDWQGSNKGGFCCTNR